jgi:hypothetical protein
VPKPLKAASKRLRRLEDARLGRTRDISHLLRANAGRIKNRENRRKAAVQMAAEGATNREIGRTLGVSYETIRGDLALPRSQAELQALRDEFRAFVLRRSSKGLIQGALGVAEKAITDGDAKSLELSTRAAVNLDKLTVSAVGEPQRVEIGGQVNVDVRALLAAAFGHGPGLPSS